MGDDLMQASSAPEPVSNESAQSQSSEPTGAAAAESPSAQGNQRGIPRARWDALDSAHRNLKSEYGTLQQRYSGVESELTNLKNELSELKRSATPAQRDAIDEELASLGDDPSVRELRELRKWKNEMETRWGTMQSAVMQNEVRHYENFFKTQVEAAVEEYPELSTSELAGALANMSEEQLRDPDIVFKTAERMSNHYTSWAESQRDKLLEKWGINPASATPQQEQAAANAVNSQQSLSARHPPRPASKAQGAPRANEFDLSTPEGRRAKWASMVQPRK